MAATVCGFGLFDLGLLKFFFLLVLCDFGMDLLGLWYVCFGSGFLLILVYIELVDFGRDGFGCWVCGTELVAGALRGEEDSGSSRLKKKKKKRKGEKKNKFK